jgi:hypothetical protein
MAILTVRMTKRDVELIKKLNAALPLRQRFSILPVTHSHMVFHAKRIGPKVGGKKNTATIDVYKNDRSPWLRGNLMHLTKGDIEALFQGQTLEEALMALARAG